MKNNCNFQNLEMGRPLWAFAKKIPLVMKLFIICLFCSIGMVQAVESYAQNARISLKVEEETVADVLKEIEEASEFDFFYNNTQIDLNRRVSVSAQNSDIFTILEDMFAGTKVRYTVLDKKIILSTELADKQQQQQPGNVVKGKVIDAMGEPMIGATVKEVGTNNGIVTDIDGNFSLAVQPGASLEISFVGYKTETVKAVAGKSLAVTLKEDNELLDEVVVVGYGTMRKADLTGAVAAVSGDLIEKRQSVQISNALQGAVAGLNVTRSSGAPGSGATIRIRGNTTIGNNDALIIVDGIPIDDINNINPNDVESISVLKDAAASSIYGSRAAAGVILVTTKRAKSGQAAFNYNYEIGFEKPTEMPEYVDVVRYMELVNERQMNDGGSPIYESDFINNYWNNHLQDPDTYPATDWQKLVYKDFALRQRHEVTMTMGTDKLKTKASLGYVDIDGLYANSGYQRYMLRINNDISLHRMLSANFDVSFKRSNNKSPADSYISSRSVSYMARVMPGIYDDKYEDGRYAPGKDGSNILAEVNEGGINEKIYNQLVGRFVLDFKPLEGLSLKVVLSPTLNFNKIKSFAKVIEYTDKNDPSKVLYTSRPKTTLDEVRVDGTVFNGQFLANYRKVLNKVHNMDLLLGYEENTIKSEDLKASRDGFLITQFPYLDLGAEDLMENSGFASESALRSYFGRINYNYKNKYYFQANARYDGSSRFHKDSRWAFFPSFSVGWVVSEENFMKNLSFLSYLKLRGSWGQVGNERIGNYPYQAAITHNDALFWQNGEIVSCKTGAQTTYAIQNITWETTETYDIGVDLMLFSEKLKIVADYYQKRTNNILLQLDIPRYLGYESPNQNAGEISTKGWELEMTWRDQIGDFNYSASFNISRAKTVINDLKGTQLKGNLAKLEGGEFDEWYGYHAKGIYQNQEQVDNLPKMNSSVQIGDICYEDISGPNGVPDGIISEYDKVLLGNSLPRYIYGGNISLGYKALDVSLAFQGIGKVKSRLSNVQVQPFMEAGIGNVPKIIDGKFWSSNNTDEQNRIARYPRLSTASASNNYTMSDFWLINGSYFRLKNITIGYKVPIGNALGKYVKGLRVYLSVNDLFSIDKYPDGWDPESSATGYPIVTTLMGGFNLNF